ncbi:MAG: nucleotide exchange factor GrpE [Candidatus Omnitrophica bacterium]|nr:nucleotide exchange factor GrpE [Candidatus Omnitrophota bacterium]
MNSGNHKNNHKKEENPETENPSSEAVEPCGEITIAQSEYDILVSEAKKAQEYRDSMVRLQADFDNARKRWDRDRQEFVKYASEGIVVELLNILDDLERVVELAQEKHQDLNTFLKGVEMILAHLYDLLKKYSVRPIDAEGKLFDPNYHEALIQEDNNDVPEHTVLEELQKGYLLNEKVVRTAKVKVSKKTKELIKPAEISEESV